MKVVVNTGKLRETTDNFTGSYLINDVKYKAEGIETGYIIADKIAALLKVPATEHHDELQDFFCSGIEKSLYTLHINEANQLIIDEG